VNDTPDQLAFEREKWAADVELRRQELALKQQTENRLQQETRRSRVLNPLVLAVLAAAAAAAGNIAVTQINNVEQQKIQEDNHKKQVDLETLKENGSRLLQAISTGGDPDKAATNLQFLLDTGLITDVATASKLQNYLANRKPGQGAALANTTQQRPLNGDISADQLKTLLESGYILGVDLNHQIVDFKSLSQKGVSFTYLKSSQGSTILNPVLAAQVKGAEDAKIKFGLYHFVEPNVDAAAQFKVFAGNLHAHHWELPPALDIGDKPGSGSEYVANVSKLCALIEEEFHVKPILYAVKSTPRPDGFSLWFPQYNRLAKTPADFLIWQISSEGVAGDEFLSGIDLNVFRGNLDQLLAAGRKPDSK